MPLASTRALMVVTALQNSCHQHLCPQGKPHLPPPFREVPQDQQVGLTQAPFKLLPLGWISEHVRFYMSPLREESMFPTALWLSHTSAPPAFKARSSGGLSSWCWTPRLGSLMWGSDHSLLGENLCSCDYPPICGLPTWGVGLTYTLHFCPSNLSHFGSFFVS